MTTSILGQSGMGLEQQLFGQPFPYTQQTPYPQQFGGYAQQPFGPQLPPQQAIQQITAQLQQVVGQACYLAMQQVQQQVPQIVAQLVLPYVMGQQFQRSF